MINKIPVSVFVITLNEEKNLARLLASLIDFDEVIVVDSGSNDQTINVAKSFGAKTFYNKWPGYARQKQFAMQLCSNEWVLNLDSDEVLNNPIKERIKQIVKEGNYDSVRFKRSDIFINKPFSSLTKKPNNLRLYRKTKAKFSEGKLVHESAVIKGSELYVNDAFEHYGYNVICRLIDKGNLYSTLKSEEKYMNQRKSNTLKLFSVFIFTFLKKYFLEGFIFSGKRGYINSVISAFYAFSKEAKLFELEEVRGAHD